MTIWILCALGIIAAYLDTTEGNSACHCACDDDEDDDEDTPP